MSADSPRRSSGSASRGVMSVPAIVPPQVVSDRSILDSAIGFINDVTLAHPPPIDQKDTITWARFETSADISDSRFGEDWELEGNIAPPLLLILGYGLGVQVWAIPANGEAVEVLSWRHGIVSALRILPTPSSKIADEENGRADEPNDAFGDKRPLIALVDGSSTSGSQPQFCAVNFISLKTGAQVKTIKFKNPVIDILANRSSIVITFHERIAVFDARTLEDRLSITTCYPSPGINPNPAALGPRWLAYAENKLLHTKRSGGGCDGDGVASYTATVLNASKSLVKGLRELGEQVAAGLTGASGSAGNSKNASFDSACGIDSKQPGIITIIDIKNSLRDYSPTSSVPTSSNHIPSTDTMIAHFIAHSEALVAMEFDNSGMLLVTADRRGHDFHVFRIQPNPLGSSLAAVHHLYILHRGDTSAKVQNLTLTLDSRWVAVSTLRGTTHVFPITPYGGTMGVRTHSSLHVVNKLSRFHRSAGLSGDGRSNSPISHSESTTYSQSLQPYNNSTLPPFPRPTVVMPLAQLRQPFALGSPPGSASLAGVKSAAGVSGSGSQRQRLSSLSDDSGKPLSVCAIFAKSRSWLLDPPNVTREASHRVQRKAVDSLFVMAGHGALIQYDLGTKLASNVAKEKICDDTPIELEVEAKAQWNLGRRKEGSEEIMPPLPFDNWLIKNSISSMLTDSTRQYDDSDERSESWLAQVEIITHAGPHRRLWMGPQFVFKTYNSPSGSSLNHVDIEAIEIGTIKPSASASSEKLGHSNPLNMPLTATGRSNAVPVLIESGSYSSIEQSPKLMDRFRHDHLDSDYSVAHGDSRLKEDLADAMRESPATASSKDSGGHACESGGSSDNVDFYDALTAQDDQLYVHAHLASAAALASVLPNIHSYDNSSSYESLDLGKKQKGSIEKIVNPLGTVTTVTSCPTADVKTDILDEVVSQLAAEDAIIHENCDESLFRPVVAIFCDEKTLRENEEETRKNCDKYLPPEVISSKLVVPVIEKDLNDELSKREKEKNSSAKCKVPVIKTNKSNEQTYIEEMPSLDKHLRECKKLNNTKAKPDIYEEDAEKNSKKDNSSHIKCETQGSSDCWKTTHFINEKSGEIKMAQKKRTKKEANIQEKQNQTVDIEMDKDAFQKIHQEMVLEKQSKKKLQNSPNAIEKSDLNATNIITKKETYIQEKQKQTVDIEMDKDAFKKIQQEMVLEKQSKKKLQNSLNAIEKSDLNATNIVTKKETYIQEKQNQTEDIEIDKDAFKKNQKQEMVLEKQSKKKLQNSLNEIEKSDLNATNIVTKCKAKPLTSNENDGVKNITRDRAKISKETIECELVNEISRDCKLAAPILCNIDKNKIIKPKIVSDNLEKKSEQSFIPTKNNSSRSHTAIKETVKKTKDYTKSNISDTNDNKMAKQFNVQHLAADPDAIETIEPVIKDSEIRETKARSNAVENVKTISTKNPFECEKRDRLKLKSNADSSPFNKDEMQCGKKDSSKSSAECKTSEDSLSTNEKLGKIQKTNSLREGSNEPSKSGDSVEPKKREKVKGNETLSKKQKSVESDITDSSELDLSVYGKPIFEDQNFKNAKLSDDSHNSKNESKEESPKTEPEDKGMKKAMNEKQQVEVFEKNKQVNNSEQIHNNKDLNSLQFECKSENIQNVMENKNVTKQKTEAEETIKIGSTDETENCDPASSNTSGKDFCKVAAAPTKMKQDGNNEVKTKSCHELLSVLSPNLKSATNEIKKNALLPNSASATQKEKVTLNSEIKKYGILSKKKRADVNIIDKEKMQSHVKKENVKLDKSNSKDDTNETEVHEISLDVHKNPNKDEKKLPSPILPQKPAWKTLGGADTINKSLNISDSESNMFPLLVSGSKINNSNNLRPKIPTSTDMEKQRNLDDFPDLKVLDPLPPLPDLEPLQLVTENSTISLRDISLITFESPLLENRSLQRKITPTPRGFTEENLILALCGSLHYQNEHTDKTELSPTFSSNHSSTAFEDTSLADYKSLTENDDPYMSLEQSSQETNTTNTNTNNERCFSSTNSSGSEEIIIMEEKKMTKKQKRKKQQQLKEFQSRKEQTNQQEIYDEELRPLIVMTDSQVDQARNSSNETLPASGSNFNKNSSLATQSIIYSTTTDSDGPLPATTSDDNVFSIPVLMAHNPNKIKTKKLEHKINLIAAIEAATSSSTSSAEESGVELGGRSSQENGELLISEANSMSTSTIQLPIATNSQTTAGALKKKTKRRKR